MGKGVRSWQAFVIVLMSVFAFFINNEVITPDIMEARNIVTAREMVDDGHWLVPTMNGELRLEKPPLPTWLTAVAQMVSPDNLALQRGMAGAAGVLLVIFFYLTVKLVVDDRRHAFLSTAILMTCYNIVLMGRTATWDIYCHAFMMCGIYFLLRALKDDGRQWGDFTLAGLAMGLSFMSKGPVSFFGLLLPMLLALVATYRPKMGDDGWHYTHIDYNPQRLMDAWRLMTEVPTANRTAYICDLIAIGRQALGNIFMEEKVSFDKAFHANNMAEMKQHATVMRQLLADLDALCAYNDRCTLSKWIDDARSYASDKAEADYYEHNARNIISTWGGKLNDYANRGWAGMFKGYYAGRWDMYFDEAMTAVAEGRDFNQTEFDKKAAKYEANWVESNVTPVSTPDYDILTFSRMLIKKYQ